MRSVVLLLVAVVPLLVPSPGRAVDKKACEMQFDNDVRRCQRLFPFPREKAKFVVCRSQAMERYGACLAGRPLPPPYYP